MLKFLAVYEKSDTRGNALAPAIRLQWQQFCADTILSFIDLRERIEYIAWRDTITLNVPFMAKQNPLFGGDDYLYQWRFRIRLENPKEFGKFSGWLYSKPIQLIKVERIWGIPKNPEKLKILF